MKNRVPNRRKNYYIKKGFQMKFIIKFCLLVMLGALISGAIVYMMAASTVTTTFENSRLTIKNTSEYILPSLLISSAIMVVLIGMATIVVTLFTSHRIAGPLYSIEKDIEELSSGNLNVKFSLRGGDEIKALAARLDNLSDSLRLKVAAIKDSFASLEKSIKDDSPEIKKVVRRLKEAISSFNV